MPKKDTPATRGRAQPTLRRALPTLVLLATLSAASMSATGCARERARETDPAESDAGSGGGSIRGVGTAAGAAGAAAPPFAGTMAPTSRHPPVQGIATLVEVRAAGHPGFDRIAFEFRERLPGYTIQYLDGPAVRCGSGDTVRLGSGSTLSIAFEPARAHTDSGTATIRSRDTSPGLTALRRFVITCDFEAHLEWAALLPARSSYRVLRLASPPRLVLDVAH